MYKQTFGIDTQWWRVIWKLEYGVHDTETWKICSPNANAESEVMGPYFASLELFAHHSFVNML